MIAQENTPDNLFELRFNTVTTDLIFMLRQIQEKRREQNTGLHAAFMDLTKAFDNVSHDGLWKLLVWLGCPQNFLTALRQIHEDQQGWVKHTGSLVGSFPILKQCQQGCVTAPTLFSHEAKKDLPDGIHICFRTDGNLFNLQHLLACTKTIEELLTELIFASYCALLTHMKEALHHIVNCFSDLANNFRLTISLKKCLKNVQSPSNQHQWHQSQCSGTLYLSGWQTQQGS